MLLIVCYIDISSSPILIRGRSKVTTKILRYSGFQQVPSTVVIIISSRCHTFRSHILLELHRLSLEMLLCLRRSFKIQLIIFFIRAIPADKISHLLEFDIIGMLISPKNFILIINSFFTTALHSSSFHHFYYKFILYF